MTATATQRVANTSFPEGFVSLHTIEPSIQISQRYATAYNFTGRIVPGYEAPLVVASLPVAEALAKVQARVAKDGYELVVYDAYRPQRAVDAFYAWSQEEGGQPTQATYFPKFERRDLFKAGFISARSGHTRGASVDLTLILKGQTLQRPELMERVLEDGRVIYFWDDGTLDFGTSFDFLDEASYVKSTLVSRPSQWLRQYLQNIMGEFGFGGYSKEWWHFQLLNEPYPDTYFDFPIV